MDWITASIELVGGMILLVFCIVPLKEFRHILTRLRHKPALVDPTDAAATAWRADGRDAGGQAEGRGE